MANPNSCNRVIICNLILKNISSFLILNKFYNLSILSYENYFKCYISPINYSGCMYFFNFEINYSHLFVSSLIFSSFVSFSFLNISIVLVDYPLRKVEALALSSPSIPSNNLLLDPLSPMLKFDADFTWISPLSGCSGVNMLFMIDFFSIFGLGYVSTTGCFSSTTTFVFFSLLLLYICLICDRYSASISFNF